MLQIFVETGANVKHGCVSQGAAFRKRTEPLNGSMSREMSSLVASRLTDRPLLGYDWIAGLLDNSRDLQDQSDEFFESIKAFRRDNKDACVGRSGLE